MNLLFSRFTRTLSIGAIALISALATNAQVTVSKTIDPANFSVNNGVNTSQQFTFLSSDIGSGGIITDVNISVTFAKNRTGPINLIPPMFNEIGFQLTYGAVTTDLIIGDSNLFNNQPATFLPGTLLPSFNGTITFDDEAGSSLGFYPTAGTFRPEDALSAFDGKSLTPGGTWTLTVYDTSSTGGPVVFDKATLTVQLTPVPEPSTYGAIGAVLLAGLIVRKRMRKTAA